MFLHPFPWRVQVRCHGELTTYFPASWCRRRSATVVCNVMQVWVWRANVHAGVISIYLLRTINYSFLVIEALQRYNGCYLFKYRVIFLQLIEGCWYMVEIFGRLLAAIVVVLPTISAIFGWVACRADLAFLLVLMFGLSAIILWSYLSPRFERRPEDFMDEFICTITHWQLLISVFLIIVVTPCVIFVSGWSWWWVALGAVGMITVAHIASALQLRFGYK